MCGFAQVCPSGHEAGVLAELGVQVLFEVTGSIEGVVGPD